MNDWFLTKLGPPTPPYGHTNSDGQDFRTLGEYSTTQSLWNHGANWRTPWGPKVVDSEPGLSQMYISLGGGIGAEGGGGRFMHTDVRPLGAQTIDDINEAMPCPGRGGRRK